MVHAYIHGSTEDHHTPRACGAAERRRTACQHKKKTIVSTSPSTANLRFIDFVMLLDDVVRYRKKEGYLVRLCKTIRKERKAGLFLFANTSSQHSPGEHIFFTRLLCQPLRISEISISHYETSAHTWPPRSSCAPHHGARTAD
jgi:hypothetical protein